MKKCYNTDKKNKEIIQRKITYYLKKEKKIIIAYLHGSFLKNRFRDIDIAIYLNTNLSKKKSLNYEINLEKELNKIVNYPCDIRIINNAPLSFKFSVIKENIVLFSKDEIKRSDFESLSIVKYHDFDYYRNRYMRSAIGIEI